ncbi:hypothetical protein AB4156_05675 [Cupriavidus sp. 2MCAB6]|uniref:hypothetical protein n=1 Tax=Cupriavidus sp. 2MCAB6 TaxID=3232981 RepID=UPI003F90D7A9
MTLTLMFQNPNADIAAARRANISNEAGTGTLPALSAQPAQAGEATAQQLAERRTRALADTLEEAIRSRPSRARASR